MAAARSSSAVPTDLNSVISSAAPRPPCRLRQRSDSVARTCGASMAPLRIASATSPPSVSAASVSTKTLARRSAVIVRLAHREVEGADEVEMAAGPQPGALDQRQAGQRRAGDDVGGADGSPEIGLGVAAKPSRASVAASASARAMRWFHTVTLRIGRWLAWARTRNGASAPGADQAESRGIGDGEIARRQGRGRRGPPIGEPGAVDERRAVRRSRPTSGGSCRAPPAGRGAPLPGKTLTILVPRKAPGPGASPVQAGMIRLIAWLAPAAPIAWCWRGGVTMPPAKASARASTRSGKVRTASIASASTTRVAAIRREPARGAWAAAPPRCRRRRRAAAPLRPCSARPRPARGARRDDCDPG